MARFWVVDTNLLVEWCLFEMAEQSDDRVLATIAQKLQHLPLAIYRDSFVDQLRTRRVAIPQPITLETGWVGHRLVGRGPSSGFLETAGRLLDQLAVAIVSTEHASVERLSASADFTPRSYADASLVVLAEGLRTEGHEPTILTGERDLVAWCAQNRVSAERFEFRVW